MSAWEAVPFRDAGCSVKADDIEYDKEEKVYSVEIVAEEDILCEASFSEIR